MARARARARAREPGTRTGGDSQSQQNMPKCSNQLHRCIAMSGHSLLIVEAINQLSATAEGYTNLTLIANLAGRELNDHQ